MAQGEPGAGGASPHRVGRVAAFTTIAHLDTLLLEGLEGLGGVLHSVEADLEQALSIPRGIVLRTATASVTLRGGAFAAFFFGLTSE